MKILEVIPQLSSGGGERFTVDLCNELSKNNEVTLLTYYNSPASNFYLPDLSSAVRHVSLCKNKGFSLRMFMQVASVIASENPDIVHLHLRAINYMLPSVLFKRCGIRYFMTIHSDAEKEAGGKLGAILRMLCFKCRMILPITISNASCESFRRYYGISAPMIFNGRSIPNDFTASMSVNAEIDSYKITPSTRVITNVARFSEEKRQPLLAKVASRLFAEGYDFTVLYIGGVRDEAVLDETRKLISPNQHILGEKANALDYLASSDAFCLCSSYEGLPISLIEALGVGTVPVCTPAGGIVDLIKDGENGILASDFSEDALYVALKRFMNITEKILKAMEASAKSAYQPYSMSVCAEKYSQLFSSTI